MISQIGSGPLVISAVWFPPSERVTATSIAQVQYICSSAQGLIYGFASLSLTETPFADLTDVTLADEDTYSILADNVKGAMQLM